MKTSKFLLLKLMIIVIGLLVFNSCKKDSTSVDYNSDKGQLQKTIDSLTQVISGAVEGNKPGNYATGSKENLKNVLDAAATVTSGKYTQQEVDNAVANILRAAQSFNSRIIQEVSVENLVAQWKFNGDASDSTGHGHNGVLKSGLIVIPHIQIFRKHDTDFFSSLAGNHTIFSIDLFRKQSHSFIGYRGAIQWP